MKIYKIFARENKQSKNVCEDKMNDEGEIGELRHDLDLLFGGGE